MTLYFITGNKNKFKEASQAIPDLEQLDINLPEIQDIDPKEIIKAKLTEALLHKEGEFIVEDVSLVFDCIKPLPGPLIKWFVDSIGNEKLHEMTQKYGNPKAEAKAIIGYAKNKDEIYFFEGDVQGTIVAPRGPTHFGWDPIFQPEGHKETFAEIDPEIKSKISHRAKALAKLKEFLNS